MEIVECKGCNATFTWAPKRGARPKYCGVPCRNRAHNWRMAYGLTPARYAEMLESQGGVCAICSQPCRSGRQLSVDHCHERGTIRGLLCGQCNVGLGSFTDSIETMERAIAYLRNHQN